MNKNRQIIIISIIIFLTISTFILVSDKVNQVRFNVFPEKIIKSWEYSEIVSVNREEIFCSMMDIQNYPNILPYNVRSVIILNKTENHIFAEETITEAGLEITLLVTHTLKPFEEHIIQIQNGNARNTTIKAIFENVDSETRITTYVEMHLWGPLVPFGLIPTQNLEHATSSALAGFEDYVKRQDQNLCEKIEEKIVK